jgi:hypothetical protein
MVFKELLCGECYDFWINPLHVILKKSKLAYRIYVILIANTELKKLKAMHREVQKVTAHF